MALYLSNLKLFQKSNCLKLLNHHVKSRPIQWWVKCNRNIKVQLPVLSIFDFNNSSLTICYSSSQNGNNNESYGNNPVQYCSKYKLKKMGQQKYKAVFHEKQEKIIASSLKIKKQGKQILSDIKETKMKMKEKMEEVIVRENIWTIPNLLCISRIGLSPLLAYFIIHSQYEYALGFVIVAGITDGLDGWIARSFKNQSTKLGSFLDPMADKVLIATLFLTLTYVELIPVYLTGLIIARDLLLVTAGFYIRYISLPRPRTLSRYFDASLATAQLEPTFISKVNTLVQLCLTFGTLGVQVAGLTEQALPAMETMWLITGITTVASAFSYVYARNTTFRILAASKRKSRQEKPASEGG